MQELEQKTIEVLLDNNALQNIADSPDYENIQKKLNKLHESNQLRVHFNLNPFLEQIEGVKNNDHFINARTRIRKAAKICNKGFLVPSEPYLRNCVGAISDNKLIEESSFWKNVFQEFCLCNDFNDFWNKFDQLRNYTIDCKREWYEYGQSVSDKFKAYIESKKVNNVEVVFNKTADELREIRREIFDKLIQKNNLEKIQELYPKQDLFIKRAVSICYQANIYVYYFYLREFKKLTTKQSDFVDIEQIIYLDKCDYIITNDKDYRNLINQCPYCDLEGRAISLSEFLTYLNSPDFEMSKRATFNMFTVSSK